MFDPEDKENAPTDHAKQMRSPHADAPFKRRPMHDWNHPAEVSPIARPEIGGVFSRGLRLKEVSPGTYASPLQRLAGLSPNLSMLPRYSTPPSRVKNFVASNPFDLALKESLHMPVYSPSLFREVASPPKNVPKAFSWTIDEISVLNPAPIEDDLLTSQPEEVEDSPETESKTQQMIDSYFSFRHNVESPWLPDTERRVSVFLKPRDVDPSSLSTSQTGCRPEDAVDRPAPRRSVACQTILSLPLNLPPEVEEALMPYFRDGEDLVAVFDHSVSSSEDSEDSYLNVSTCSLRRRLFQDTPRSPAHAVFSPGPCSSPIITCGTVLPAATAATNNPRPAVGPMTTRSYGTPLPGATLLMSPGMSPMVASPVAQSGPVRRLQRVKSKTRLDFTEDCSMSVDVSFASHDMSVDLDSPTKDGCQHDVAARRRRASAKSPGPADAVPSRDGTSGFRFSSASVFGGDRSQGIETLRERSRGLLRDEGSVWEPSSKHIVSSTPAKVSP